MQTYAQIYKVHKIHENAQIYTNIKNIHKYRKRFKRNKIKRKYMKTYATVQ